MTRSTSARRAHLARQRVIAQRLAAPVDASPAAVVAALGAVQSQDYPGAAWAVAQRARGRVTAADVRRALDAGEVLRTHVLRPTWHLVARGDLRWMLALTGPRVHAAAAAQYRATGLDAPTLRTVHDAVAAALEGGPRTRDELADAVTAAGVDVSSSQRMAMAMMHAELEGLVASGPMRGAQHTYALLDARAPASPAPSRDEALAMLAARYFVARGPATARDLAWWSGLSLADALAAIERAGARLARVTLDDVAHWAAPETLDADVTAPAPTRLLANYDELLVAYADRGAHLVDVPSDKLDARGNVLFQHTVVVDGVVAGVWRRVVARGALRVEVTAFRAPKALRAAVRDEAARLGDFLEMPSTLTVV